MKELTHLSLFSGVGGMDLTAEWAGFKTVGQCEFAEYPTKVLEKHWPDVPRWKDIRTLTGEDFYGRTGLRTVDVISGGFPCQPFSVAGKQRGKEDDRYLWPEMVRVIKELRPTWVVGENVAGIMRMALPDILSELEACGYRTRAFLIPACAVGARHRRYRVAIVGYSEHNGPSAAAVSGGVAETGRGKQEGQEKAGESPGTGEPANSEYVANSNEQGLQGRKRGELQECACEWTSGESSAYVSDTERTELQGEWRASRRRRTEPGCSGGWPTEPGLGGMADGPPDWLDGDIDFLINHYWDTEPEIPRIATGIPNRVSRLKALGNAVVPQQFYPIFKAIAERMED